MRRLLLLAALSLTAATLFVACRQYLPTNRYLQPRSSNPAQSTADARNKFDHAAHSSVLASANITCADCHRFDVTLGTANEEMAKEQSLRALYPGSEACHYCHLPSDTKMTAAPSACTTCHTNLAPLRPEDHDLAWSKVHAAMARANPERCEGCHRQAECINCHERRDTIQTVVHDRNFRFFHGIEARANPMQCGSCHREDFCIRCHQQGKVDLQP